MKRIIVAILLVMLCFPGISRGADSFQVTGTQFSQTPTLNVPVTLTVSANKANLVYRFYYSSDYRGPTYPNWEELQAWSASNACTFTVNTPGRYVIVVWVAESVADFNATQDYEIVGLSLEVQDQAPTTGSVTVINTTSQNIYYIYIKSSSTSNWGTDRLENYYMLPGESFTVSNLPVGTYDFKAEDAGHTVIDTSMNVSVDGNITWTVTDGGGTPNIAGTWAISVRDSGCGHVYDYQTTATVTQNGQNVTVYFPDPGLTVQGTLNGNTLSATNLPVSYPQEGGTTTVTSFSGTISNNGHSISYNSAWTWTGYGETCSGTSSGTGTR